MSYALRIIDCISGEPTEFDGQFVKEYDPTYVHPDGYDGGILEVTKDPRQALCFDSFQAALDKWKQPYGTRCDGKPNRPLTAFTVSVEAV